MIGLSTYSGECDGLGWAAEMAGIEVAAYCEADPKRRAQLAKRNPGKPIFETDTELTANALRKTGIRADIIFGGPPCQPFSIAGPKRGTADPRHRWPEMFRLVKECRPRWVFIENVGHFVRMALDLVWSDLESEGYEIGAVVLPASAVGAPHRRDRCFVVAHLSGNGSNTRRAEAKGFIGETNADGSGGDLGYTQRGRCPGDDGRRAGTQSAGRCEGMAVPACQQPKGSMRSRRRRPGLADSGCVEYAGRAGREELDAPKITGEAGYLAGEFEPGGLQRAIESRLGGVLDGVSHRLDTVMASWPAWRGQEQYAWEPPRTATGIKDRQRRIESLGLAVVPWQAYPLFVLIKEMDDALKEPIL